MQTNNRNILVVNNMHIVHIIMHQYYIPELWKEDIQQEGYMALVIAAEHYDATRGIQFNSYAAWWVRKYILEALRSYGQIVRLPRHELPVHIFTEELGKVVRVEDDEALTYEDILPGDDFADAQLLEKEKQESFAAKLDRLSDQELLVLNRFYGLETESVSTTVIATEVGMSQRQVERIIKKIEKKLR